MTMTHASLFSGIGGFDLAAAWAGWTNVFNCEIDPFCRRIEVSFSRIGTNMKTYEQQTLPFGATASTCSPAVSRASRSASRANARVRPTTATSGPQCSELFGLFDRAGSWARTFSESLIGRREWFSSMCALIWKRQEAEERMREKAHKIVKEMMGGIFQGDMPQKIADEFIQKQSDE